MSIEAYLLRLSPGCAAALRAEPELAQGLAANAEAALAEALYERWFGGLPEEERASAQARREEEAAAHAALLQRLLAENPEHRASFEARERSKARARALGPSQAPLALGKAWLMIHFALTGRTNAGEGPADLLMAGTPLGGDAGYGPARLHEPVAVQDFADALGRVDGERLIVRLDPADMARRGVYPLRAPDALEEGWDAALRALFPELAAYVRAAADAGDWLLGWMS